MTVQATLAASAISDRYSNAETARVVVLMNFVPPHRVPILLELAKRVEKLTVLISTPMEPNRSWEAEWGMLDVQVQRTLTLRRSWRHKSGFTDSTYLHVPWDTVSRLRELSPDVVISGQLGARSILSTYYKMCAVSPKLIFWVGMSEHTERGRGGLNTAVRKFLLRRGDGVVVNGRSGVRYLQGLGVDSSQIFRCPYSTSSMFFEHGSHERPASIAHKLLYVGQLVERKGLIPFLRVLQHWAIDHRNRSIEFDLVGDGPLKEQIANLAMPDNVRLTLHGPRPFETLPHVYANAGIFVFPTLADDWGMVVNEAMSSGVPVLGSRYSQAVEDFCVDGINGWTFRPDVGSEMECALDAALSASPDQLNAMRQAGREAIAPVTPEAAADVLFQAIKRAMNQP